MRTVTKGRREQKATKRRMNERMLDPCLEPFSSLRAQPMGRRAAQPPVYVLCLTCAAEIKHPGLTYSATQWEEQERQVPRAEQLKDVRNRNEDRNTAVNRRNGLIR
jgi:hypothetical protein